jgi:hypothetical protein
MELLRAFSGFTKPSAKGTWPTLSHVIAQARPREQHPRLLFAEG